MTVAMLYESVITLEYQELDGLIALYEHSLQELMKKLAKIEIEINWKLTRDIERLIAIKYFNGWTAPIIINHWLVIIILYHYQLLLII